MVTTSQKYTIDSQKPKRKAFKHTLKENHQATKRGRNEESRTIKTTGKQGLKWQLVQICQ